VKRNREKYQMEPNPMNLLQDATADTPLKLPNSDVKGDTYFYGFPLSD